MIWVIGDIHGMFDPLNRLITEIRKLSVLYEEEVEKVIFIGDYIDHGPSSKEVIDLVMDLEFEKVLLMGNHEDLLLQFYDNGDELEEYGNVWFNGNGGQETIYSFSKEQEVYKKLRAHPGHRPPLTDKKEHNPE